MDGVPGLGAQRIHDADDRDQHEAGHRGHRVGERRRHRRVVEVPGGERQHAQAALGELPVGGQDLVAHGVDGHQLAMPQGLAAALHDHVGGALDTGEVRLVQDPAGQPVGAVVERRHELVLGVERHLGPAGQGFARLRGVGAHLRGEHDERRLGRIADDGLVIGDGRVRAQTQAEGQAAEVRQLPPGHAQDRAGLPVAGAFDRVPVAAGQHRGGRHRVHRQRAGLVAVDDRRPAQGLDVGQRLDHRLRLGQAPRPGRQHGLDERRQAGRDRRDRGRHAQQQQGLDLLAPHDTEDGDHRDGQPGDRTEHLGHAVELPLQRRAGPLRGGHHVGDLAHLGRLAGRGDHEHRRAAGDLRVLEDQVRPVAERDLTLGKGRAVLAHRRALAGEGGFLHLERRGG